MKHRVPGLKRFEISGIEVQDSVFDLYIDTETRELHILDLDLHGRRTVTNNAHYSFFKEIQRFLQKNFLPFWEDEIDFYTLFLYGTDGIASRFDINTNSFHPLDPLRAMYQPFNDVMRARFADTYLGVAKRVKEDRQ